MRYLSVCSGIEAATVAWHDLGWKPAAFSEIEPFPSAVLKHHYPDVPNHGDMTALPEAIRAGEVHAADLLCGGTPCQAFSVAGKRQSLDDARGNLSLTFCEIANAIDHVRAGRGEQPCIVFWENVPGVLNTKDNAFGCFLGELAGESCELQPAGGKWTNAGCVYGPKRTVAWRVLDAQYFGVAQRRRRVFVVASARTGFDPAAVLFESEGVRRDTAPSREARKETTGTISSRTTGGGNLGTDFECAGGLQPVAISSGTDPQTMATLCATDAAKWGSNQWVKEGKAILQPTYGIPGNWIGRQPENGGNATEPMHDVAPCLTKTDRHGVAQPIDFRNLRYHEGDVAGTMQAKATGGYSLNYMTGIQQNMAVRRLTPVECERLQGFPDNYTNIPWRKQPTAPDGPRYKALGNSWAVPVVRWIGKRIQEAINAS
jgi:DNA (cytosine-5)-methyltransferase 1